MTDSTFNSNDFKFDFRLQQNSQVLATKASISSNGDLTLNGTGQFITFSTQPQGANAMYGIRGMSALDDPWFVGSGSVGNDLGYLEIATGDNTNGTNSGGQIYVRQYNGQGNGGAPWYGGNGTVQNELILLDNVGNTTIPKNLTVDSGTLFVDATNNRVGINNTSPTYELHIDNGSDSITQFAMTNNERTFILTNNGGDDLLSFNYGGSNRLQFDTTNQWFNSGYTGFNNTSPAYTVDISGGLRAVTATSAERPVFQYNNSDAGTNSLLFLRKNFGATAYTTGDGAGIAFQIDSDSQVTNQIAIVDATYDATAPIIRLRTNANDNATGPFIETATFSSTDAVLYGDLTVGGDTIKKSGGTSIIEFYGTNSTSFAGDITVIGNSIRSSTNASALELTGSDVEVVGDLTITGNDIKSSAGTTAITLSGTTVSMPSDLTVDSGTLKVDATNNRVGVNNNSPTVALDVTGNILATGDVQGSSLTSTGRIDADGALELYSNGFGAASVETQVLQPSITGNTILTADSWSTSTYRTAKYTISMSKSTNYHCIEMMIIHNGTTAYMTQYNEIIIGSSLATFSADISGGLVRLRVTPATTGTLLTNIERKLFSIVV